MERADDDAISRWIFGGDVAVDVYSCLDGLASHLACIKCRSQVLLTGGLFGPYARAWPDQTKARRRLFAFFTPWVSRDEVMQIR